MRDIIKPVSKEYIKSQKHFGFFRKYRATILKAFLFIVGIAAILAVIFSVGEVKNPIKTNDTKPAPEIIQIEEWVNSKSLNLNALKGQVKLVHFWSYTSKDCLNAIPYLNEWHEKYSDKGLKIIAIHSPQFEFERNANNIKKAVEDLKIKYPVAIDSEQKTKEAYNSDFVPQYFIIDKDNFLRLELSGKGNFELVETKLRTLLTEAGSNIGNIQMSVEDFLDIVPKLSPKIYAGYETSKVGLGNKKGYMPEKSPDYAHVEDTIMNENKIYLFGRWFNAKDHLRFDEEKEGNIAIKFFGKGVDIVAEGPAKVKVVLDGKNLPQNIADDDIIYEEGNTISEISEARLYSLIDGNIPKEHVLRLITNSTEFKIYSIEFN